MSFQTSDWSAMLIFCGAAVAYIFLGHFLVDQIDRNPSLKNPILQWLVGFTFLLMGAFIVVTLQYGVMFFLVIGLQMSRYYSKIREGIDRLWVFLFFILGHVIGALVFAMISGYKFPIAMLYVGLIVAWTFVEWGLEILVRKYKIKESK